MNMLEASSPYICQNNGDKGREVDLALLSTRM
jgi:hypothetical protein